MGDQDYLDLLDSAIELINSEAAEIDQLHQQVQQDIQQLDAAQTLKNALSDKFDALKQAIASKADTSTTPPPAPAPAPVDNTSTATPVPAPTAS